MHSEIGALDEAKVRSTFERLWNGPMTTCQKRGDIMVSGRITIRIRVNHAGEVKWAFLKETNLGDRAVEKCILDSVRGASWPTPEGGEDGIAEQILSFADHSPRPPTDWPPNKTRNTIAKASNDLTNCRANIAGPFVATAIINKDGSVASVGIQQPDETADDATDCITDVIRTLTFPKTGSWPAKVSFDVP